MSFNLDFLIVGLMQVIGFFIQGTTGFGCTVIAAPVVMAFLGTEVGVPYGTLIVLPFIYYLGLRTMKEVSWKDLVKIVLLCTPSILLGNYLFYVVDPTTAKISIGAVICFISLMNIYKVIVKPLILKQTVDVENEVDTMGKKIFRYSCLLLGGVVHGAFTIGGPLITVYTLQAIEDKKRFRNTMTWVWIVLNSANAFNQYRNGAFTPYLFNAIAIGLPLAAIGFYFGVKFLDKINKETFLRIVYVVLLIIGTDMLVRNILTVV